MNYSFRLTKEQYISVLKDELKEQRRDVFHIIVSILLSAVQFGCAVYLLLYVPMNDMAKLVVTLLSSALFGGTLWWNFALEMRARQKFRAAEKAGYMYQDMDSIIRFMVEDGVLRIYGGKNKLSYDCAYLSQFSFTGEMLALIFKNGNAVHRILIPVSAFGGKKEASDFAFSFGNAGEDAEDEEPICTLEYSSTEKSFVRDYVYCCRHAYLTSYMWTSSFILKVLLAVFLMWSCINGSIEGALWQNIAVIAALLLLSRLIAVFTPLMKLSATQYAKNLFSGREKLDFLVSVGYNYLTVESDSFKNRFPLEHIMLVEKTERALCVYISSGVMLAIPTEGSDAHLLSRCYVLLNEQCALNRKHTTTFRALRRKK